MDLTKQTNPVSQAIAEAWVYLYLLEHLPQHSFGPDNWEALKSAFSREDANVGLPRPVLGRQPYAFSFVDADGIMSAGGANTVGAGACTTSSMSTVEGSPIGPSAVSGDSGLHAAPVHIRWLVGVKVVNGISTGADGTPEGYLFTADEIALSAHVGAGITVPADISSPTTNKNNSNNTNSVNGTNAGSSTAVIGLPVEDAAATEVGVLIKYMVLHVRVPADPRQEAPTITAVTDQFDMTADRSPLMWVVCP
jgi:hypothetical protein